MHYNTSRLILLFFIISSCNADDDSAIPMPICEVAPCESLIPLIPSPSDTCVEFPPEPFFPGWNIDRNIIFGRPLINPVDANEMFFVTQDSIVGAPVLQKKANFCTGETEHIYTSLPYSGFGTPKWGETDWILYTSFPDHQIWKIKSNGDSLQQVTDFPNICYNPSWINEGNNILVSTKLENDPYNIKYVLNPDGEIVDTIFTYFNSLANYRNGKLATSIFIDGVRHIGYYDLNTEDMITTSAVPQFGGDTPIVTWVDQSHLAYLDHRYGIYQVSLLTDEVTLLREECDNVSYSDLHASPQTNGILYFRENRKTLIDSVTISSEQRIYKLNVYTDEQWLVDLED